VERLGFEPIVLHEKPNKGRTIIEKFDDYSDVGFAIALLSADDVARAAAESEERFRARQNVIFELGFFLGRLGRDRVAAVYRAHENFEMPSDYAGVLFIEYDSEGAGASSLQKNLRPVATA
jgi:predicted nucleotide-binding protein